VPGGWDEVVRLAGPAAKFQVFDFRLDDDDMSAIAALDDPTGRMGPDPLSFA